MSRVQRENFSKLNVKDKKLVRLFHNKNLSKKDQFIINYMYEERQNIQFIYGIFFNAFLALGTNYALFKTYRRDDGLKKS